INIELFSYTLYVDNRHLHSFPTPRSSDLDGLEYRVAQRLREAGLDTVFGGRWVTVIAGSNKGRAVRAYRQAAEHVYGPMGTVAIDRKSTRLNSSHDQTSYAVFCLKKKNEY